MQRPTLSTFRSQWPSEAMGICQSDPQIIAYCNDAQQRLLMDPMAPDEGWWGGYATMNFTASVNCNSAYIVTPNEVARLIVMDVCKHPIRIRNGFYEYLQFGAGLQPKTCQGNGCGATFQAFERDNVVTFAPLLPTPQTVRVYPTDARDIGRRVLLQGKDQNGQVILTTDPGTGQSAPGEYIVIVSPFADSVNLYTAINGIQKDQTYGMIQLFQVDPLTSAEAALSTMEPNESAANYRRYLVNGVPNLNICCTSPGVAQVSAQARLAFSPVANETDYLLIQNVPSLVEESLSIFQSRIFTGNAVNQSQSHHARALALLNGQLDQMCGKTSTAVNVPIFGSSRMRRQPV